jgi:cytochrome c5
MPISLRRWRTKLRDPPQFNRLKNLLFAKEKPTMRHSLAFTAIACASLLLAACGQSDAPGANGTAGAGGTANTTQVAASAAQPVDAAAALAQFPSDAATLAVGETIYKQSCFACHDTGAAGAPKRGDKAAWAPRIALGSATLYQAALKGLNAMPPRGSSGGSDDEIKASVDFIVAGSH